MKKKDQNLITLKISYSCDQNLIDYIRQYNSLLKFTYNRLVEHHLNDHDINVLQKDIKNCDLVNNSWFRGSAYYDAKARVAASPDKPIIFGGKWLFLKRCQHKISKEEFQQQKLAPLYSIGEVNVGGNRFFKLIDEKTVEFRPDKRLKFKLQLGKISKKRSQILNQLTITQLKNSSILSRKTE